jgi:glucose/arabinose dehydrogenase
MVRATGSEQGLLSVAFPPSFVTKRYFYVDYTGLSGIGDTVVARYPVTANSDLADAAGGVTLLRVTQPFENHNGGQLAFGPDGFLYVAMGDGGSAGDPANNAQSLTTLLGKILRIDVEAGVSPYVIPASNPFFNNQSVSREIWSYGLRNPWRFS